MCKHLLPVLLVGTLAGCWRTAPEAAPLEIDHTSPALGDAQAPVLLNDALTVYFSDAIMPLSVTPDSVTVLDELGHQVPGSLHTGTNWVAFQPHPPLSPDLNDGSFRPGGEYRLRIAGYPRPDSIRAKDGRWLSAAAVFPVRVARLDQRPPGLPSVLRPPPSELPFFWRGSEVGMQVVAADAPRLQLHFTQPLLPGSVQAEAFDIRTRLLARLQPRSVRVVTSPLDEYPGSTVEIDLGALPLADDGSQQRLADGDWISVELRYDNAFCDYAGNPPLPSTPQWWRVVAGRSLPLCEWPAPGSERAFVGEDGLAGPGSLLPGFEYDSTIRPRVRVEAGNGSLGIFRPQRDVTLRPGEPFDCGDGRVVVSDGADFPFLAIDVPASVRVTIDARHGPVRLLSCGGIRISGELRLEGSAAPLPAGRLATRPVSELLTTAPVALLAAGDIEVRGAIVTDTVVAESQSPLLLATAGWLRLHGSLPFQTMLVVEWHAGVNASRIEGTRGQSRAYSASFTYGLAPGADFGVRGVLPWQQLPPHQDSGALQLVEARGAMSVLWQSTPADALRGDRPDLGQGRVGSWQVARDGDVLGIGAGAFARFELQTRVREGQELPRMRELRLIEK